MTISGDAVINAVIWLVVLGVIFWLLWWLVDYIPLPAPFNKVAKVILAVGEVLVCINVLLSMAGHPIIQLR